MRRAFCTGKSMYGGRTSVRENAECVKESKRLSDDWAWKAQWVEKKRELERAGTLRQHGAETTPVPLCLVQIPDPKNPRA